MQRLSRAKRDTIWTKHQVNQEGTQKCDKKKVVQIISRIQINTWFKTNSNQPKDDSKAQQPKRRDTNWNQLKRTHDWEGTNWKIKPWVRKPTPKQIKVQTNKPSTLFMMAQSTKTKRFVYHRDMSLGLNTNWERQMNKIVF